MTRRFISATLAFLLLATPSTAQTLTDDTTKTEVLSTYMKYVKENLALVASTAAIASGLTAGLFLVFRGRAHKANVDPAQQRRDALALLAAAAQIVHPGAPHLGGGHLLGGDLQAGADSLTRSVLLRPTQVNVTAEQQRRLQAARIEQAVVPERAVVPEQPSRLQSSSSSRQDPAPPSRIAAASASARAATQTLSRGSTGSASRRIGQKPKVSEAAEKLETLVARLNDINSASNATALRNEIVAHLQTMTPTEIGEAAQAAFFWDKMLSEPQGYLFFIALTVDQLKAALASIVIIWPPRGTAELIDVVEDRMAYLLQPVGNAIDRCIEQQIVDLLVLQLQAILDQHLRLLQRTDLDVMLRRAIQSHPKFEKNMRSILGKLKVSCKENPAFTEMAAYLLPQILEIEESLRASLKMELPLELDKDP